MELDDALRRLMTVDDVWWPLMVQRLRSLPRTEAFSKRRGGPPPAHVMNSTCLIGKQSECTSAVINSRAGEGVHLSFTFTREPGNGRGPALSHHGRLMYCNVFT